MENGNGVVTQIIDTAQTSQQAKTLLNELITLDAEFVQLTKDVIAFNKAAGDSKGLSDFTKNAAAAQQASEKQIQTQNKAIQVTSKLAAEEAKAEAVKAKAVITANKVTLSNNQVAVSNARLQSSQEKATAATQKALSPYQQLSKELDKQRLAAKDLGVQYGLASPQFEKAKEGVLKLDNQLKTLDKSLGQNQRNVGNYEESVKSALESFYDSLNEIAPGAGRLTRTVVEGFQRITSEARKSKNEITNLVGTPGGFGFKPSTEAGAPTQIVNTGATTANTEAVTANTSANEANAVSEGAKATATEAATTATAEQSAATTESTGFLAALGEGFGAFTTVAFVAAVGAATYYLSQFKSTANEVSIFTAGLKNTFASAGETIVDRFKIIKDAIKNGDFGGLLDKLRAQAQKAEDQNPEQAGEAGQRKIIALRNIEELEAVNNATLTAESEKNRALSKDRKIDIADRVAYIKKAQDLEQQALDNKKETAEEALKTAIQVGNKLNTLSKDQIKLLEDEGRKGNLKPAQSLSLKGQQFTEEGFELYKEAIQKQVEYKQSSVNQIVKLQADADNIQLRADNGLAKAQLRLDKARVESALESSKLILDDADRSGKEKLKANQDYVTNSIKLIEIQRKNELESAGLGSSKGGADSRTEAKNRLAIEVETQNEINKVKAQGLKQEETIQKAINAEVTKDYKLRQEAVKGREQDIIADLREKGNQKLLLIETQYSKEAALLAQKYKKGLIDARQYNEQLKELQRTTAVQKVNAKIDTSKGVLETQAFAAANGVGDSKGLQSSANDLVKLQNEASDLATQNEIDNVHKIEEAKKQLAETEKAIAEAALDLVKTVVDGGYERELEALRKKSQLLDENAAVERDNIKSSLLSSKQKAAQERILNAQVASQKKVIATEEAKIKTKQAETDKAISIARIIENTAIAITSVLSIPIYGEALAIAIGVLGALELAKVIATPIPKYAKGTKNHPGGYGIVGDAGAEIVKYPDGHTFLTPNAPTLLNMPEGTTVVPHLETVKQLSKIMYAGGESISMKEVAALLRENNKYQKRIAEKNTTGSSKSIVNDLVRAASLQNRRNDYFK